MPHPTLLAVSFLLLSVCGAATPGANDDAATPPGFHPIFDGATLDGWKGLVGNPITRAAMTPEELAAAQSEADDQMRAHWSVDQGELVSDGHGPHLCTASDYGDYELILDWKIAPGADSGIYLRGTPQVQIWDPINGIDPAKVGSGGLYNNQRNRSTPLAVTDNPAGAWNTFRIRMVGELVWVWSNDELVVDGVAMENYWDRARPIFPSGQIELQTHGGEVRFRNLFLRTIPSWEANATLLALDTDGFFPLFNGVDLTGWKGSTDGYLVEGGTLVCDPQHGGTLLTDATYDDFVLRFEFRLPPGGNNGLTVRAPGLDSPAYNGLELQILDNDADQYAALNPWQYHGSVYGLAPAHRGYLRPPGTWNVQEVTCDGGRITVRLNGTTILETDLADIDEPMDGRDHPGRHRTDGHLGFMGHGARVAFRSISLRPIVDDATAAHD